MADHTTQKITSDRLEDTITCLSNNQASLDDKYAELSGKVDSILDHLHLRSPNHNHLNFNTQLHQRNVAKLDVPRFSITHLPPMVAVHGCHSPNEASMAAEDHLEAALANLAAAQHRLESSMDALLLRLPRQPGHLYPSSSLKSPPSLPPRLTTTSSSSAQPPPPPTTAPTSVAPMAPLPLPRFHSINRHFQLSRPLPLSIRTTHRRYLHDHCRKTPYSNDTILLGDDAVKHQIHPRLVWILFAIKTCICSVCHR